ncbi:MAG: hypothetical protein JNM42_03175 [Propionivibrio sp.]|nr:hypothetical protein [Propionivibrio sp.]
MIELELRCGLPVEAGIYLGDGYLSEWLDAWVCNPRILLQTCNLKKSNCIVVAN